MVTLKQIAENLDLSVMAVSKALRDAPDISKQTKRKVKSEADRLGYIPNHVAKSLREGRTGLLGLILPSLNDSYPCNLMWGVEQDAFERDYQLIIGSSRHYGDMELRAALKMFERKIEALFIYPVVRLQHRSPVLDAAARYQVPIIFLDHYPADAVQYERVSWVSGDNFLGGKLATHHLIELGHRNILYFSGPLTASSSAEHFSGYKKALSDANIEFTDSRTFLAGVDYKGGEQAISRALEEKAKFSAIVCANDAVAIGACEGLKQQGYSIPGDVSVVGYGDGPLAENYAIPLTTVRQPQQEMGRSAFNLWHQWKFRNGNFEGKILPVDLVNRKSTLKKKKA